MYLSILLIHTHSIYTTFISMHIFHHISLILFNPACPHPIQSAQVAGEASGLLLRELGPPRDFPSARSATGRDPENPSFMEE